MEGECSICTVTYCFSSDQRISVTSCGHVFHGECISKWFQHCGPRKTCPECRTQLNDSQVVPKIYINIKNGKAGELAECKKQLQKYQSLVEKLRLQNHELERCVETKKKECQSLVEKLRLQNHELEEKKKEIEELGDLNDSLFEELDELDELEQVHHKLKQAYQNLIIKWRNQKLVRKKVSENLFAIAQGMRKSISPLSIDVKKTLYLMIAWLLFASIFYLVLKALPKAKAIPSHSEKSASITPTLTQESLAPQTSRAFSKRTKKLPSGATKTAAKRPRLLPPGLTASKA